MFSPQEIDAVLKQAQTAVDSLAQDVGAVAAAPVAAVAGLGSTGEPAEGVDHILKIRVPVAVRLAEREMILSEILAMGPGTILEFNRPVDSELDLMVNNAQIGRGVAVKVNERFGLQINHLGNVRERIRSLGG